MSQKLAAPEKFSGQNPKMQEVCSIIENEILPGTTPKTESNEPIFQAAQIMREISCGYGYGNNVDLDKVELHLDNLRKTPIVSVEESQTKEISIICRTVEDKLAPASFSAAMGNDVYANRALEYNMELLSKLSCRDSQLPNISVEIARLQQFVNKEKGSLYKGNR